MKTKKIISVLLICLLLLSACASPPKNGGEIDSFSFINQDGEPFGTEELTNSIWIADFIFTNCTSICKPMTSEMAALQQTFKEQNISIEFISFSVDPAVDSPDVLKSYVQDFTDDLSNWNLLTGYSQEQIEVFAREQFQTIVQKPTSSNQVIHSSNFYLIDKNGNLVSEYNYIDSDYIDNILRDIKSLKK